MSGALALVARGTSIARGAMQSGAALAHLFNGGGGIGSGVPAGPLTLGGFAFADMELPESIQCGGSQQVAVHTLPGGGRIVDVMGPSEAPISWSGIFLSADAAQRSQQLSEMRRAGQVVPLAWGGTVVPVVVTDVQIEWRNPHWVPYRITCTVLPPPPAKGKDADDEDDDLGDMDDDSPGGGILGALGDAAGDVGGVLTDVANEAGRIVGVAQGALAAVSGVIGPITSALGIQVPFLSQMAANLNICSTAVGFVGSAGAGLSSFGAEYGSPALLSDAGSYNSVEFNAADGRLSDFDGAGVDIAATPETLGDQTDAARDSAVGATTGGAVNSAQVAQRAASTSRSGGGRDIPAPPLPPSGGGAVTAADANDPSSTASAPPPSSTPDVTPPAAEPPSPGNSTTPAPAPDVPPSLSDAPANPTGDGASTGFEARAAARAAVVQNDLAAFRQGRAISVADQARSQGQSEDSIKRSFDQAGRSDLYQPPGTLQPTSSAP